jgi:CubicO group peptidase (beta-lactamase class C family)
LLGGALVLIPVPASAQTSDLLLRDALQGILAEEGLVGAAWATVHPDGSIRTDAAGCRDNSARTPFSAQTRFHVGSVAKAVLATGILRLVTENRIALDEPVTRYLPMVRFDNPWAPAEPVTVRHLLDHTSGLDDARLWQMFSATAEPDAPLSAAFSRSTGSLRIRVRPGDRMSYSNTGYTLLGMVIEAVTGSRYESYLDAHLLKPLGMSNSTFRFTMQEGPDADSGLAWGHLDEGSRHAAVPVMLRPAAQFTTTAHDFALFARFLMTDGTVGGRELIRADLARYRSSAWRRPELIPFSGVLGLFAALPLFMDQSFIRLGDMTAASVLLAAGTAALPLTMIALLWRAARSSGRLAILMAHAFWAIAVLQWCAVLATWDLLPVRLWV